MPIQLYLTFSHALGVLAVLGSRLPPLGVSVAAQRHSASSSGSILRVSLPRSEG